jgi:hypothetical protein
MMSVASSPTLYLSLSAVEAQHRGLVGIIATRATFPTGPIHVELDALLWPLAGSVMRTVKRPHSGRSTRNFKFGRPLASVTMIQFLRSSTLGELM